jgi:TonB-linked SusC/RagA family outer membrane protein
MKVFFIHCKQLRIEKVLRLRCLLISALLLGCLAAVDRVNAQTINQNGEEQAVLKKISGTVSDIKGEPIIGVSVVIKGSSQGTITDPNGNYSISIKGNPTLIFSSMGYIPQEFSIKGHSIINVVLAESVKSLNEVVVLGYGSVKKSDLTGSVGLLKSDDIERSEATSITQGLEGKIAGVQVSQNDGAPGGGISILVRGANSFSTSADPLYVVDGIPYTTPSIPQGTSSELQSTNPLSSINPEDIESIEVLKDASSTAIYGSRGANGVVLITTKSGQIGKDKIEFSTSLGFSTVTKKIAMLDGYEYANMRNEAMLNKYYYEGGTYTPAFPAVGYYSHTSLNDSTYNPSPTDYKNGKAAQTNWQDQIFRTAITNNYNFSYSGGNTNGNYLISFNYLDQDGIIVNSGYKRLNINNSINRKLRPWLEVGTNSTFSKTTNTLANTSTDNMGIVYNAIIFTPARGVYDPQYDNVFQPQLWEGASNPYTAVRNTTNLINGLSYFNSSYLQIKCFDFLTFRQNIGLDYSISSRDAYYPVSTATGQSPTNGYAIRSDNDYNGTTSESMFTFNKTFAHIHTINAVAAMTYEYTDYESHYIQAQDFPNDYLTYNALQNAIAIPVISSGHGMYSLMSFLGRINYNLLEKYLFTASFRRDGSSRFTPENRWGNFSSYAFAWRASEESFIKDLKTFDNLKFRISYGSTGNQGIPPYATQSQLGAAPVAINGTQYAGYSDVTWSGPSNPNLKWETTYQFDLGVDAGFLNNRLNLTIDAYQKLTDDLLQNLQIPSSTGFTSMESNYGNVTNKGLDIAINAVILKSPISWVFDGNISFDRNRIGGLSGDQFANSIGWDMNNVFIERNGQSIGAIWGYKSDGFYNSEAAVRADPAYANAPESVIMGMIGEQRFKCLNGNPTATTNSTDETIIGNTCPKYTFGITNTLVYKSLSLSFFFQGCMGNDIINSYLYRMTGDYGFALNIPQSVYNNRWIPENLANGEYSLKPGVNAEWPILSSSENRRNLFSDKEVEDGSYLRLKNINIGYTFNKPIKNINSIKIYSNISNVFTLTKYSWYDPEASAYGSDPSRRGVDLCSYPASRTITFGLKCEF